VKAFALVGAVVALSCAACLHEPAAAAPATPQQIAQCQTDARLHTAELVAGAMLGAGSLGLEWGALEASNTSSGHALLADLGALAGALGLAVGVLSSVTFQAYEDDGCGDLTPAGIARQRARDLRTLDLVGPREAP
jgi:hypothetical protein